MTGASAFHQGATYRELRPVQRQQIDAADHNVPAQQRRIHMVAAQEPRHHGKMLSLNQRHLPFA
jgi:site-specific DNA-cytosine methylase